uniref:Iron-sulfur cluster enzyme family protein, carboxy terminus n=2 Tax=Hormoscilla spongeliae TaxID=190968 RepID=A0A1S6M1P9_9CYAN|nr:truncated iron-sulfur cluster enzyme family protein [Hormoscilla spongeliae GUM034]AQU14207.1 iron-sulfur cluster enzyme family protein, carboxy terminus [Hormoscilla spongeliae SP4]
MRREGFAACPGLALGGLTDYVYLAEKAGLGAIGYHGLLISPLGGARLRINTIYTNITNLPLESENEHLWIRDYCSICKKCISKCPPQAIFNEPQPLGDGGMQCIDHNACRGYFQANFGCAICLAVCPFSKAGYDKIKATFTRFSDAKNLKHKILGIRGRTPHVRLHCNWSRTWRSGLYERINRARSARGCLFRTS